MKLYNTLSRKLETIEPINRPAVTIYTCGPTVYDYPHVGNWFTFIRYDLLVRALKHEGLQTTWVMNITDVGHLVSDDDDGEDKLEKGARREGKTAWDVAAFYGDNFITGLAKVNNLRPDHIPKATDHIKEQIAMVQTLEAKGYAYVIDDGVYYDTSKFEGYAAFARLDLDDQQAGARVEFNTQKRNASDFALWKRSPEGQKRDMEWDSPWGKGFPGWHIECSAMSAEYLGPTIDIHAGGIDHVPVHHTNEIAQSEAANGQRFANYWMHANHISVNGEKISKSLGNGITLEAIETEGITLQAFRLHVLESHYRSQSKFSWESLEAAMNRLQNYQAFADLRFQTVQDAESAGGFDTSTQAFEAALQDDLNTPLALSVINGVADDTNLVVAVADEPSFRAFLTAVDDLLGLELLRSEDITAEQKALVGERDIARRSKDWQRSDTLRDALLAQGIGVRDTPAGTIWYRTV